MCKKRSENNKTRFKKVPVRMKYTNTRIYLRKEENYLLKHEISGTGWIKTQVNYISALCLFPCNIPYLQVPGISAWASLVAILTTSIF